MDEVELKIHMKDRANVDDVEKELEDYSKNMEEYINALKLEIKSRIHLISILTQAETQLENDKKDVKLVTTAYRTFASRVKNLKKKLDEKLPTLTSPIPSPDVNAPSPSPDSDIELPLANNSTTPTTVSSPASESNLLNNTSKALYTNAGYYNPVPPPSVDSNFNSSFTSFIGADMPFNLQNLNTSSSLFGSTQTPNTPNETQSSNTYSINNAISTLFPLISCPPPPPAPNMPGTPPSSATFPYNNSSHVPLLPPPMPPFSKSDDYGASYGTTYTNSSDSNYTNPTYVPPPTTTPYQSIPQTTNFQTNSPIIESSPTTTYEQFNTSYPPPSYQNPEPPVTNYPPETVSLVNPYPPPAEEYNPEEDLETWEPEPTWEQPPIELDTPESPPMFEKKGYGDPVEYHDGNTFEGVGDIDQRVLPPVVALDEKVGHRVKDVDHRNLISLTGSPNEMRNDWSSEADQDYRKPVNHQRRTIDQDYRVPFNIENFKLPPPPPPPNVLTEPNINSDSFDSKMYLHSNPFNPNISSHSDMHNLNSKTETQVENIPPSTNKNKFNSPAKRPGISPRKVQDNNENIDMDLSDEDQHIDLTEEDINDQEESDNQSPIEDCFELPPPPFPDLLDDMDANNFLDNVNEDLENLESLDATELEEDMEQVSDMTTEENTNVPPPIPPVNFKTSSNLDMFNNSNMPPPNPEAGWLGQNCNDNFQNHSFPPEGFNNMQEFPHQNMLRGRGGNMRNFNNNRGMRGNWMVRGHNDFRGRGRWPPRGMPMRGNRGMQGNRGMRGVRFARNWGGPRGRGDFRGRGNFRGGF